MMILTSICNGNGKRFCNGGCNGEAGNVGRWLRTARTAAVMSHLDGCGRQMGAENCADGCGRRGGKGVAGNGWREEAAGDERPSRLRTANGCGELRGRLRTA